jgi:hypothetical protein
MKAKYELVYPSKGMWPMLLILVGIVMVGIIVPEVIQWVALAIVAPIVALWLVGVLVLGTVWLVAILAAAVSVILRPVHKLYRPRPKAAQESREPREVV